VSAGPGSCPVVMAFIIRLVCLREDAAERLNRG
jgi:hypothetical protein